MCETGVTRVDEGCGVQVMGNGRGACKHVRKRG